MRRSMLFFSFLLTACGGSDGGPTQPPPPPLTCVGTGPVTTAALGLGSEVEPNDDIATAFGVTLPTPGSTTTSVGVIISGGVHDTQDRVDTFSFTSSRTIKYFLKLCEASCNPVAGNDSSGNPDSLDTSIAYFEVLDAAGNVAAGTQANSVTENYLEVCVEGGVITYLMVTASNTSNANQSYRMFAFEAR